MAYMAKFGVPWFQETKASLWQIMILRQSRPYTVCTSNIGSLGQRVFGTHRLHTLCWGMIRMPWFPETKACLWQIMILWQSRPCTVPSKHDINGPFVVSVKATNGRNGSMASHFLSQMARFSVAICLPFKACHEPAVNGPLKASHFTAI